MTTTTITEIRQGGAWLLENTPEGSAFTPERMTEEQRMIDQTAKEFVTNEVIGQNDQLETKDWDLARDLMRRCGELGLMGTDVPEVYGGVDLDTVSSTVIASRFGQSGSFSAAFGAQTNLVIMPIRIFGTEEQKKKYLPKLVNGEMVGAYCLSESGSGSDALGVKTRVVQQEDGSFVLSGEKMWVTNGGFAHVYIVFAKIDGEQFTAFIVERAWNGVTAGKEEHKLGLLGSSTTPIILQDVKVPAENLLGKTGEGHKVAFNVLNYARFKLGASTVGTLKTVVGESARYSEQRHQFGQSIANFGAIKYKLGEMNVRAYAIESMVFRTAGLIDAATEKGRHRVGADAALLSALEEYAVESSILKVAGSEILHDAVDENVQIHGGNGYVREYPAERHYRDTRVNRIFEGTNEINRLLIPGMLVKRALKGGPPLITAAKKLQDEITGPIQEVPPTDGLLEEQARAVQMFKRVALAVLGLALQIYGEKLSDQQEVLSYTADILIDTFGSESVVLRAKQAAVEDQGTAELQADASRVYVNDGALRIDASAKSALATMTEGDTLRTHLVVLRRLLKVTPVNTVAIRRRLADKAIERSGYIF